MRGLAASKTLEKQQAACFWAALTGALRASSRLFRDVWSLREPQAATLRPGAAAAQHQEHHAQNMNCNRGNPDVTGFVLNQVGRGVLFNAALFLLGTYLYLANKAAGCPNAVCIDEDDNNRDPTPAPTPSENCGKVWGARPAALVSFGLTIGQVTIACLMPVVGSVVDHSHHRKSIGVAGLGRRGSSVACKPP